MTKKNIGQIAIIFCVLLLVISQEEASAQGVLSKKISLSFKKKNIEDVVKYLQNFHGVGFSYSKNLIDLRHKVSGEYKNINLKKVLDDIFEQSDVMYSYKAGMIILHPKPKNEKKIILRGVIRSKENLPVGYAGIQIFSTNKGTITDEKGQFILIIEKENLKDSIHISSLGYYKATYPVAFFISENYKEIFLNRRIINLNELKIKASDFKNVKLGNKKKISFGSIYIDTQGQQTALFIENKKKKEGTINSVSFYISRKGNTNSPFRVRIYKKEKNNMKPGEDILKEVLIARPKTKGGWYKIDLSQFDITAPSEGFFVGIEGILPYDYLKDDLGFDDFSNDNNESIPNSISYGQRLGYSKKKGKNTWHYSLAHTWFQLKDNNFNVMIAAEIQVRK